MKIQRFLWGEVPMPDSVRDELRSFATWPTPCLPGTKIAL